MVTESIGNLAYTNMANTAEKTGTQSGSTGFATQMTKAQDNYNQSDRQSAQKTEKTEVQQKNNIQTTQKQETVKQKSDVPDVKEDEMDVEKQIKTAEVFADLVNQFQAQVEQVIADSLGVDTEDVAQALENLGMDVFDLQDSQNLLKLMVSLKDLNGMADILTSQEMPESFKALSQELSDMFSGFEAAANVEVPEDMQVKQVVETPLMEAENKNVPADTLQQTTVTQKEESHAQNQTGQHQNSQFSENMAGQMNMNQTGIVENIQTALEGRVDEEVSASIVRQVTQQMQVQFRSDVTSIEMQLYPEHLGKVSIQVAAKNGVLTAQISTETEAARAALISQMEILKENLNEQGLRVESVEVMVSSRGFEQEESQAGDSKNEQPGHQKKSKKLMVEELLKEREPEEETVKETLGNTVSYTA